MSVRARARVRVGVGAGQPGRGAPTRVARLLVDGAEGGGVIPELGLTPLVELLRARRAPEEPWHHGGTHCEDEVERGRHAQAVLEADAALGVALAVAAVAVAHLLRVRARARARVGGLGIRLVG